MFLNRSTRGCLHDCGGLKKSTQWRGRTDDFGAWGHLLLLPVRNENQKGADKMIRKQWFKFKIQLTLVVVGTIITGGYCNSAHASQADRFQIYDKKTDSICTYYENEYGYASSDDPDYMGPGVCWRKDMMDKADFHIRSEKK